MRGGGARAGRDRVNYWTLYLESHTCPFRKHYSNYKVFNQDGVLWAAKQLEEASLVASFCAFTFYHSTQPPTKTRTVITVTAQYIPCLPVSQYRLRTMKLKVRLEITLIFTLVSVVVQAAAVRCEQSKAFNNECDGLRALTVQSLTFSHFSFRQKFRFPNSDFYLNMSFIWFYFRECVVHSLPLFFAVLVQDWQPGSGL